RPTIRRRSCRGAPGAASRSGSWPAAARDGSAAGADVRAAPSRPRFAAAPRGARGAALSSDEPLPRLPMQRVAAAPAAVLLELDTVRRVPLGLLRLVVAPLALGARERDSDSDSGFCHGFFFV